jgi:hypothetical protein
MEGAMLRPIGERFLGGDFLDRDDFPLDHVKSPV